MTEEESPVTVEIKRQVVILLFTVATAGAIFAIQADPSTRQRIAMRASLWVKQRCLKMADRLEDVAARAATVYNRNRSTPTD